MELGPVVDRDRPDWPGLGLDELRGAVVDERRRPVRELADDCCVPQFDEALWEA